MNRTEHSGLLLLQFFVDLFKEADVMPDYLSEIIDHQSRLRDFTYVDDAVCRQILLLSREVYQGMPTRTIDDGFDLHKNYCNAQFAWLFTAKNVSELIKRFLCFDAKGVMKIFYPCKDTLRIEYSLEQYLGPGVQVYENMFAISCFLGVLRACTSGIEIDIHYASKTPAMETYIRDKGKCNIKRDTSTAGLTLYAPNLLEIPLLTRNDTLSLILEPVSDFIYVDLCKSDLVSEVRNLIKKNLHISTFSLNDLAADMDISRRTLQRRLKEHQLTFNRLLRDERQKRAIDLINEGHHDRSSIVEKVGYTELSSLYRLVRNRSNK